jgi:hypothetical protein
MTQQNNVPNVYQLAGDGIQVTYTVSNTNGEAQLDYQDSQGSRTFTGNQVNSEQSPLGTLVTVFLLQTVDMGSTTLTLVVPGVNLGNTTAQPIETFAVVTNNLFSILEMHKPRQTQVYQIYSLQGTAGLAGTNGNELVTLSVDAASYDLGNPIVATLNNQGAGTIYFLDHLTNCTVIQLQRQVNGNWEDVNPCLLEIATRQHHLDAGQNLDVELQSAANIAGLYRASLTYQFRESGGPLVAIHSPEFQVGLF